MQHMMHNTHFPRHVLTLCSCLQLASGEVYGKDQPIALQLLGSERSKEALEGVAMELEDSLYPLLREVRRCAVVAPPWDPSRACTQAASSKHSSSTSSNVAA